MKIFRILSLVSLLVGSNGFSVPPAVRVTSTTRLCLMTPEETEAIMKHASDLVEGKCETEEVKQLIQVLKEQQKELTVRVDKVNSIIKSLEVLNTRKDRKADEVRETVRAIWRIFQLGDKASNNDYPKLSRATGWSGEVGDGPTTAWDSLPPKKWKPAPKE